MNNLMFIISDVFFILLYVYVRRLSAIVQKRAVNADHPILQSEGDLCKRILYYLLLAKGIIRNHRKKLAKKYFL